jgi:hypothetical protein
MKIRRMSHLKRRTIIKGEMKTRKMIKKFRVNRHTQESTCNTSGVTMARAHLGTKDCDHMWQKLKEQKCKGFGN